MIKQNNEIQNITLNHLFQHYHKSSELNIFKKCPLFKIFDTKFYKNQQKVYYSSLILWKFPRQFLFIRVGTSGDSSGKARAYPGVQFHERPEYCWILLIYPIVIWSLIDYLVWSTGLYF